MTSRERVNVALEHKVPDKVPLDLGGSTVTGMHVSSVYKLRQALGLDPPRTPVKVIEPYQMLGEIGLDLVEALHVDVAGIFPLKTIFGFKNEGWKEWTLFDGTPVLVPEKFNTIPDENEDILMYPEGDTCVPPSARMPKGGYYFDSIIRQIPIDETNLNPKDNMEEFVLLSDKELKHYKDRSDELYNNTDKAILINFGGLSFGDIANVPAPWLKNPKGIRDIEEWYISLIMRKDYIKEVFEYQCDIGLANLKKLHEVVGDKISIIYISGTDFGMQTGPFLSVETYCELFKPYHKKINEWIHSNTNWYTFIHSCGSIVQIIPEIIDAGFDILNPVQISAAKMDPHTLKESFGDCITFWGGGIDTQKTLPFGNVDEVRKQVKEMVRIFGKGGGFVFNSVHNIQANVPIENLIALYEAFEQSRSYRN
ncbi:MAG: methyltransferase [Spirochaetes bacterium]|nr:MAG: methyltransferase [Spirochaetota bacterium]